VIGPSQGRYLNTNTEKHTPNIHALSGIRTYDHGFRESEDSACLRPLGYRDRRHINTIINFQNIIHCPNFYLKHFGDWTVPPSSGNEQTLYGPTDRAIPQAISLHCWM
jgi:hypothetical protein